MFKKKKKGKMAGVFLRHLRMSAHNPRAILHSSFMLVSFVFHVGILVPSQCHSGLMAAGHFAAPSPFLQASYMVSRADATASQYHPGHVYCNGHHPNAILSAKGRPKEKKKRRGFKHVPESVTRMLGCFPRIILKHRMLFWDHPKDF